MRRLPYLFLWVFIAVMCFAVISVPILAADRVSDTPDAVAGARCMLSSKDNNSAHGTHFIEIPVQKGGTVRSEVYDSARGCIVDLAVQADIGYEMSSINVITATGEVLKVEAGEETYSFVMPSENVVVDVTFQLKRI